MKTLRTFKPSVRMYSNRGNAMVVAILFSGIITFAVISYVSILSNELPMQAKRIDRNRAMEIADAGLEHALWKINSDTDWWVENCEDYTEDEQIDDPEIYSPYELFEEEAHYVVDVDHLTDTVSGRPNFFVRATGYITRILPSGQLLETMKTMAVMTRPEGFSDYARVVLDGDLSYAAHAVLDGKVHTNRKLYLNGYPITFRRAVSVGVAVMNKDNGIFLDEVINNVTNISLQDETPAYSLLAQNGGIYYDPVDTSVSIDLSMLSYPPDFNGILYCTKSIKVKGTPSRPITLVANDDVYITDHINQGWDPRHVVGLIAKDMVYLDESTPNDLQVNAALMSINNTWKALGTSGSKTGLTIRGAIITKYGGSANAYLGGPRNYIYDRRLLYYMPPMFPDFPGGQYVLSAWLEAPGESDWRTANVRVPDTQGLY